MRVEAASVMVRAWSEWVRERPWDHVAVLTFRDLVTVDHAVREVQRWLRLVSQRSARRGMQWIWVMEQVTSGAPHAHVLTYGTAGLAIRELMKAWSRGHTHVRRYDPQRGGASYLVKTIGQEGAVYDLSAPPRQRSMTSGR